MNSNIYLDESGDLGWTLDKPYRNGGSSKYLTLAYLVCPIQEVKIIHRFVKDFYNKFNFDPKVEAKATELKPHHKEYICNQVVKLLTARTYFHLGAITVNKESVPSYIRNDANKLYNYMIHLSVINGVLEHNTCKITRDFRSVKAAKVNNCIDYLQTIVWLHENKPLLLKDNPTHSHTDDGIIFIDWITNIVWSKYEDKYSKWCDLLGTHINETIVTF